MVVVGGVMFIIGGLLTKRVIVSFDATSFVGMIFEWVGAENAAERVKAEAKRQRLKTDIGNKQKCELCCRVIS